MNWKWIHPIVWIYISEDDDDGDDDDGDDDDITQ